MIFRIRKGKHRAFPPLVGSSVLRRTMHRNVVFDTNCKYTLESGDQEDVNKLFGLAFVEWYRMIWVVISWPFFILFNFERQHKHSVRVGWRYSPELNKIILSCYCYVNGERIKQDLCPVWFDRKYKVNVYIENGKYVVSVWDASYQIGSATQVTNHNLKFSYPLGVYFGGNNRAPHTMTIKLTR